MISRLPLQLGKLQLCLKREANYHIILYILTSIIGGLNMSVTVKDILKLPCLNGATVVGGAGGLTKVLSSVTVLELSDDNEKLKVFDKNGVYLPMKKVGKNNPKAEQIQADNKAHTMWNQTVDRTLVWGVPDEQIMEVKQNEAISEREPQLGSLEKELFIAT